MSKERKPPIGFKPNYMQREAMGKKSKEDKLKQELFIKYFSILDKYRGVQMNTEEMFAALSSYIVFRKGGEYGKEFLTDFEAVLSLIASEGFDEAMHSILGLTKDPS